MTEVWTADGDEPTIGSIGEVAAIGAFTSRLPTSPERILGPGDDAAVLGAPDGRVVVTSDSLVEGPDFLREWSSPYDLGWKLVAVNLADLAAMGARPSAIFVALALPPELPVRALVGIAQGIADACFELGGDCGVEGGDITRSSVITAVGTAIGSLEGREPVRRDGARPGDLVAVSGQLGRAARGLQLLGARGRGEGAGEVGIGEPSNEEERAVAAQLRPRPPVEDGPRAAEAGATAMLDVSDGLAIDAARIATGSRVTLDLAADLEDVLGAAEDHALLATFPPEADLPEGFRVVGRVVPKDSSPVLLAGSPVDVTGWDPFASA